MAPIHSKLNAVANALDFSSPYIRFFRNVLFVLLVAKHGKVLLSKILRDGIQKTIRDIFMSIGKVFFSVVKAAPGGQAVIQKEVNKVLKDLEHSLVPDRPGEIRYTSLPAEGLSAEKVRSEISRYKQMETVDYTAGKVSGTIYHDGNEELLALVSEAYTTFCSTNPLHPDVFPSIRKMDAEIVSMVVKMFNGSETACGTTTSGGTESILMACKAYRDLALEEKGIKEPEMIVPITGHAAFDKGSHYFGIKLIHVPVDEVTRKVDLTAMRNAITSNTVMLVGSAPSFPHGIIDDIEAIAQMGRERNIPVHVDACLGGFVVAFMEKAGFPLPRFDFRVPGVTSISCDTHKFGLAPKGSSVIMYSEKKYRSHQYFVAADWTGGIYASPTLAGSRPGALLAGCWAAMVHMGEDGYVKSAREIVSAARKIKEGINAIPNVFVYGDPLTCVVGFGSNTFDIYRVGNILTSKGWNLNSLQYPSSIHICVTRMNMKAADELVADIREAVDEVMQDPSKKLDGMGAMYGMAQSIPDRTIVDDIARGYIDVLYKA